MVEKLKEWATVGDGGAMYNLAVMYDTGEGVTQDLKESAYWLKKAAETEHIDAMKEYAAKLRTGTDFIEQNQTAAINLYKEIIKLYGDEETMENFVDMCSLGEGVPQNDSDSLNFLLDKIGRKRNAIYQHGAFGFQTLREDECTMNYLRELERRRIARRVRRMLNED